MTDPRVKTLAIALCKAAGHDPFEQIEGAGPAWAGYGADARLTLRLMDEDEGSLAYAKRLATDLCEKHYPESSGNFHLMETLPGLLGQIDNMTSNMIKPAESSVSVETGGPPPPVYVQTDSEWVLREATGFKDRQNVEIHVGDVVRVPVKINEDLHGSWGDYRVIKRPGGYVLSYLRSEKGQIVPKGFMANYMSDMALEAGNTDLKMLLHVNQVPQQCDEFTLIDEVGHQ